MMAQLFRARRLRRVTLWLLVPILGVVGAIVAATPSQAATGCAATYRLVSYWVPTGGGIPGFHGEFDVTNTGTTSTSTWTVRFTLVGGTKITEYYNATRLAGFTPTFKNSVINGVIAPGSTTTWGFIAQTFITTSSPRYPQNVTCTAA